MKNDHLPLIQALKSKAPPEETKGLLELILKHIQSMEQQLNMKPMAEKSPIVTTQESRVP